MRWNREQRNSESMSPSLPLQVTPVESHTVFR